MKDYSEKEILSKAEAYCSAAERCPSDVEAKLKGWGASHETVTAVMACLFKEKYLDTVRFCSAYVRDKYRFNRWGRVKIARSLLTKGLTLEEINTGMEDIDEEEYNAILQNMLKQKAKSIKVRTNYERNARLIRFAVSRGFTMQEIMRFVKDDLTDEHPC